MGLTIRDWVGSGRASAEQRLAWPRMDAEFDGHPIPSTDIPKQVKRAVMVMAVYILRDPDLVSKIVDHNRVLKRVKAGQVDLEFAVGETSRSSDITSTRRRYNFVEDILGGLITDPPTVESDQTEMENPGAVFSFGFA